MNMYIKQVIIRIFRSPYFLHNMVLLFLSEVIEVKKWFKEFIDRLGKSNEKTFGSGSLKCCDLNKEEKKK